MTAAVPSVRSILAALDESGRAPLVLATAAMLARGLGAQVFLIRVLALPPEIPPAAHSLPDGLANKLERDARAELHKLMEREPIVQFGPPVVVEGEPWRRILGVAKDLDVDMIVLGSHRFHGLERVLGTTASKVATHADRDVVVVHDRPGRRPDLNGFLKGGPR